MFNNINSVKKLRDICFVISVFSLCICLASMWFSLGKQILIINSFINLGLYGLFWILFVIFGTMYEKLKEIEKES